LILIAPLVVGAVARSHALPIDGEHATGLNTYRIVSMTVPSTWNTHIDWAGNQWDAVPSSHAAFVQSASPEFNVTRVSIDGQYGKAATMTVNHNGSIETKKFDSGEVWYVGSGTPLSSQLDLRSIALHEFGHALYLEHSSASGDVMYSPTVAYGGMKRTLTTIGDESRMQQIYP
jgi:hypothetical protein